MSTFFRHIHQAWTKIRQSWADVRQRRTVLRDTWTPVWLARKRASKIQSAKFGYITGTVLSFVLLILSLQTRNSWHIVDGYLCPQAIGCTDPCVIAADPDIAGIGVFVSFCSPLSLVYDLTDDHGLFKIRMAAYIQTISMTLLLGFSSESEALARGTLVLTSLAITATIAIFSLQGDLNLNQCHGCQCAPHPHHATASFRRVLADSLPRIVRRSAASSGSLCGDTAWA